MEFLRKIWKKIYWMVLPWLALACQPATDVEVANADKVFIVGNSTEVQGIDPQMVSGVPESTVIRSIFEGLCADHPEDDVALLPGVAESWEPNERADQWTFRLNPRAKWSDGQPLLASDFVFAYERMLHPDFSAKYADMLYFIEGAQDFNLGVAKDFVSVGVQAVDAHTLVIKCRESVPYLPLLTRHYTWFPVPPHAILRHGRGETREQKMTDRGNSWTKVENFVGNGAFKLKTWRFNNFIEVERNEHYWDAENVWLNGIKFMAISNPYTETRGFLAGQLHTTYAVPNELVPRMKRIAADSIKQEPYLGSLFLRCNTTRPYLDQVKFRQALNYAIDRRQIAENLLFGYEPATSLVPPFGEYKAVEALGFDPEKARQLLREAGIENSAEVPPLTLLATSRESSRTLSEAVQAMWSKHLGLEVKVSNQEWTSYLSNIQSMDFDVALGGWIGDYLDPTTFLYMWGKDGGNNNTGWWSEEFDQILEEAASESDAAERLQILRRAEQRLMDDYPVVPIAWYARNYLLHPSVEGWHPLLLDNHNYKFIRLRPLSSRE